MADNGASEYAKYLRVLLKQVLEDESAVPEDWLPQATTYDLPRFSSEAEFVERVRTAVQELQASKSTDAAHLRDVLSKCGHPYDYARLGHPFSTLYEHLVETLSGAAKAVSFASKTKPYLAVAEARDVPTKVSLYFDRSCPLSQERRRALEKQGVYFHEQWHGALPAAADDTIRVRVTAGGFSGELGLVDADAVTYGLSEGGVLLILDKKKISPYAVQKIRKRTTAALLAESARQELAKLSGAVIKPEPAKVGDETACKRHLNRIYNGRVREEDILFFVTGLAAEAAVFAAAAHEASRGGKKVLLYFAENGYGGTGQLISEILPQGAPLEPKPMRVLSEDASGTVHTLIDHICADLRERDAQPAIVFLETPTNPQLQVHDFEKLMATLREYRDRTHLTVPVLVDITMAPMYPLFDKSFAAGWPFIVVKSGSKYYTKGKATLGVAFSSHDDFARHVLQEARRIARDDDNFAKPFQLHYLNGGLEDLDDRMTKIARNAIAITRHLEQEMERRGKQFTCFAMKDDHLKMGLASGIISFYLPPPPLPQEKDLVDEFVEHMLEGAPDLVRNRVSYGQSAPDGGQDFIYVINPQESTQGSLSQEVKDAQKRGGVQICRISVPANTDVHLFNKVASEFFVKKYDQKENK